MTAGFTPIGRPVRVGIVGLGRIFDLTVRAHRDFPDAQVVALCDVDPARVHERGADWPHAARFTDLDEFLAGCGADMVEVLVPTLRHCEVVCKVLDAGYHVNLQKPMARTLPEADRMIAAAEGAGKVLRVMENYLFFEPLRVMKGVVEAGEIGDVAGFHMKMVGTGRGGWDVPRSTWEWQFEMYRQTGAGILVYDDGWHKFSVARWLFGPVAEVMAWVGDTTFAPGYGVDAPSTIMWKHANGVRGVWDITLAPDMLIPSDYYTNIERFEVTGTSGFARVNHCTARGIQEPSLEVYRDGELRAYHALDDDWASSFRDSTRAFVHWLRTGEGEVLWTAPDARDVLAFLLGALESSRRNAPVRLTEE